MQCPLSENPQQELEQLPHSPTGGRSKSAHSVRSCHSGGAHHLLALIPRCIELSSKDTGNYSSTVRVVGAASFINVEEIVERPWSISALRAARSVEGARIRADQLLGLFNLLRRRLLMIYPVVFVNS